MGDTYRQARAKVKSLMDVGVTYNFHEFYVAKAPFRGGGQDQRKDTKTVREVTEVRQTVTEARQAVTVRQTATEVRQTATEVRQTATEVKPTATEVNPTYVTDLIDLEWAAGNADLAGVPMLLPGNPSPEAEPEPGNPSPNQPEAEPGSPVIDEPGNPSPVID